MQPKDYRWDDRVNVKYTILDNDNVIYFVSLAASDEAEESKETSPFMTFEDVFVSRDRATEEEALLKSINNVINGAFYMGIQRFDSRFAVANIMLWVSDKDGSKDVPVHRREMLKRLSVKLGASLDFYYDLPRTSLLSE